MCSLALEYTLYKRGYLGKGRQRHACTLYSSVTDPKHYDVDPDPDPSFHFVAGLDPDPTFHSDADPDPAPHQSDSYADLDSDLSFDFDVDPCSQNYRDPCGYGSATNYTGF
jgi:hypothetical protein